jgi:organic hydroperoxide reductase OsmC/OhrA
LDDATEITIEIRFGRDGLTDDLGLAGTITGYLPGLEQGAADDLMQQTHQVCPYSRAIHGNVAIDILAKI